jgi:hypothetical protein
MTFAALRRMSPKMAIALVRTCRLLCRLWVLSGRSTNMVERFRFMSTRPSTTLADLFVAAFHGFVFCSMGIAEMAAEE